MVPTCSWSKNLRSLGGKSCLSILKGVACSESVLLAFSKNYGMKAN